jgi:hypothetical protein
MTPYEAAVNWIVNLAPGTVISQTDLYIEMRFLYYLPESDKGSWNLALRNCRWCLLDLGNGRWQRR